MRRSKSGRSPTGTSKEPSEAPTPDRASPGRFTIAEDSPAEADKAGSRCGTSHAPRSANGELRPWRTSLAATRGPGSTPVIKADATGARRFRSEVAQADQQPSRGPVVPGVEAVEEIRFAVVEEPAGRVSHEVRYLDHERE